MSSPRCPPRVYGDSYSFLAAVEVSRGRQRTKCLSFRAAILAGLLGKIPALFGYEIDVALLSISQERLPLCFRPVAIYLIGNGPSRASYCRRHCACGPPPFVLPLSVLRSSLSAVLTAMICLSALLLLGAVFRRGRWRKTATTRLCSLCRRGVHLRGLICWRALVIAVSGRFRFVGLYRVLYCELVCGLRRCA
jgi:hypothetical protein